MRLPNFMLRPVVAMTDRIVLNRDPDVVIGDDYLYRWYVIPRNKFLNIYLHCFMRSDEDAALHDHPWWNLSCLLHGCYVEHTIASGGINHRQLYEAGDLKARCGSYAHRIELIDGKACWSLFITGPKYRKWGFHCPFKGWVYWKDFVGPSEYGQRLGAGCGET